MTSPVSRVATAARWTVRGLAELLVTAGVLVLLFAVYLVFWSDVRTAAAQHDLRATFEHQTQQVAAAAEDRPAPDKPGRAKGAAKAAPAAFQPGAGIAAMRIPRLGRDWEWIVVEGVAPDDLAKGPGHFPGTAGPGEIGNFAVAGHRATNGEPFAYLDTVVPGDHVIVQTPTGWSVYTVTRSRLVAPTAVDVVTPVPGQPGAEPDQAVLTLVTCHPRWGSSQRLIVDGLLTESRTLAQGPPSELST